ncbi:MAG TPA: rhodanese-like domain-containing protein [Candidatus Didemnitutus sp.]|jgi:adenylyltransferase/sulfurtransferase
MDLPLEIDVATAARMMSEGAALVDVREPWELAISQISGCIAIPMREIPAQADSLPQGIPLLILCQAGVRSRHVAAYLRSRGRQDVTNVAGGIQAWAEQIDHSLTKY